jgi:hypothetical protein
LIIVEDKIGNSLATNVANKGLTTGASPAKRKTQTVEKNALTWPEKYRPKVPSDIIGNQSLVCVSSHFFAISLGTKFISSCI